MKNKLIIVLYKAGSWICWKIPGWLMYPLAAIVGDLYYWLARSHSRHADVNVQIAMGEPKVNRRVRLVARKSFRNYFKYMVDFLRIPYMDAQQINELVTSVGWHYLTDTIADGKGAVMVSSHFGNWDAAVALMKAHGYKSSSVARDFEPAELNELIQGARRRSDLTLYSLKDSFRGLVTTLKNNGYVILLVDSPLQNEGILVNLLGRPARLAAGPGVLVYRTGARLLLGYVVRQPGNKNYYGCWEPIQPGELNGEREHDVHAITQAIADAMGKIIRRHPDQWYMFRRLFLSEAEMAEHQQQLALEQASKTERRKHRAKVASDEAAPEKVPEPESNRAISAKEVSGSL